MRCAWNTTGGRLLLVAAGWFCATATSWPQDPNPASGGPIISDSSVGYVESALPVNRFRLRGDDAFNTPQPSRAEFIYARGGPFGPGLPLPETRIDFAELTPYVEVCLRPDLSVSLEVPLRSINPEINRNDTGLGDLTVGAKYACWQTDQQTVTLLFRATTPTGDPHHGLGTNHVSLETGLLLYRPLADKLLAEGELRCWVPVGGTNFAGPVFRAGVGVSYCAVRRESWSLRPVVELVSWTVLGGKEQVDSPPVPLRVVDSTGATIVNAKAGLRVGLGSRADVYAGYGRCLTGDQWYHDLYRVEVRWRF